MPSDDTPDDTLGAPFEKLSIFYPMWNEEEYIDRALSPGAEPANGSSPAATSATTS
jgi:hypothetical protein